MVSLFLIAFKHGIFNNYFAVCYVCAGRHTITVVIPKGQRMLQTVLPLAIGSDRTGALPFHGKLGHLVIFNSLLSPDKVLDVFNVSIAMTPAGALGRWCYA